MIWQQEENSTLTKRSESRNGAAVAPSCKDGNLVSDDGKPRDKVSDTVGNMAAGEPCQRVHSRMTGFS